MALLLENYGSIRPRFSKLRSLLPTDVRLRWVSPSLGMTALSAVHAWIDDGLSYATARPAFMKHAVERAGVVAIYRTLRGGYGTRKADLQCRPAYRKFFTSPDDTAPRVCVDVKLIRPRAGCHGPE